MRDSDLKNYTLLKRTYANAESRLLLDSDGKEFWPFTVYMDWLHRHGASRNTRISYATDVAYFLDYLAEAGNAAAEGEMQLTAMILPQLFSTWPSFSLLTPEQRQSSDDDLICVLGKRLSHRKVGESTVTRRLAALRGFTDLSDRFQQVLEDRRSCGLSDGMGDTVEERMFPELNKRRDLSIHERQGLIRNSMLAGVISRGPVLTRNKIIRRKKAKSSTNRSKGDFEVNPLKKAFPRERIEELIETATSFRDKAYLSLLAASGVRGSEARQVLWQDIDPLERTVHIVPPWDRRFTILWDAIPSSKQEDIAWKGRETQATFLLEPYASLFFEYLEQYRNTPKEWDRTIDHPFVFVQERRYGYKPLLLSTHSSIADIFKKPMKRLQGLPQADYAAHSLRHAYGYFLANKVRLDNGTEGLPIQYVRDLMGHAAVTSTEIYAPVKREKIMQMLSKANEDGLTRMADLQFLKDEINKYRVEVPANEKERLQKKIEHYGGDYVD